MITREDNSKPYPLDTTFDRIRHVLALPHMKIFGVLIVTAIILAVFNWTNWFIVAALTGVVLQYFIEYCFHRFLYHMEAPDQVDGLFKWLYSSHWGHHDFPNNPNLWGGSSLWFVPVIATCIYVLITGILFLAGNAQPAITAFITVFAGAIPTFAVYEWAHVTAHAAGKKNWLERYITREHAVHHFQDYNANYHVSAGGIMVDKIYGTAFDKDTYVRPENIRTMGLAPNDPRLIELREIFATDYNITEIDRKRALS